MYLETHTQAKYTHIHTQPPLPTTTIKTIIKDKETISLKENIVKAGERSEGGTRIEK